MNRNEEAMQRAVAEQQPPKHSHIGDIIALVVCLAVALCLWLYVMETDSPEYEEVFSLVSVEIENATKLSQTSAMSVIGGWSSKVDVKVNGRKSDIVKYTAEDIGATVDVGALTSSGAHSLEVNIELPEGLRLVSCSPASVTVSVDYVASKQVRVVPQILTASYDAQYELGEPVASPANITVTGPSSVLDRIDCAKVYLNLGEITSSVVVMNTVTITDENGEAINNPYLVISDSSVSVTVPVYEKKQVPLEVGLQYGFFNPDNCRITIEPETVTLRGEKSVLDGISSIVVRTINEKLVTSDMLETVTLSVPANTTAVDGVTTATVKIEHIGTAQRTLTVNEFAFSATGFLPVVDELAITLRGPIDLMRTITPDDIIVRVPVNGISGSGEFRVEAEIQLGNKYAGSVYELGTYYITIRKS